MSTTPEPVLQPTVHQGAAAEARLHDLGLDTATLHLALDAGDVAARQATPEHPVGAAGTYRWMETVAALRRELSLPIGITDRGVIQGWRERIVLPPLTFGPDVLTPGDAGGNDDVTFHLAAR